MSKNLSDIYEMSTDYELLWRMINEGYRIDHYFTRPNDVTENIAMAKIAHDDDGVFMYWDACGIIGDGYKDEFLKHCKDRQVRFIPPTKPRFEWVRDEDGRLFCRYNDQISMKVGSFESGNWYHIYGFEETFYGIKPTEQEAQTAAEKRLIELITPKI